jgi:Transposase IS200 like
VERCSQHNWSLLAGHVRTNHVHIVVESEAQPERIMNDLKSYASRCLNRLGLDEPVRKRWARHGSTRWLWEPENVSAAIRYVVDEQGERIAVLRRVCPEGNRFLRARLSLAPVRAMRSGNYFGCFRFLFLSFFLLRASFSVATSSWCFSNSSRRPSSDKSIGCECFQS